MQMRPAVEDRSSEPVELTRPDSVFSNRVETRLQQRPFKFGRHSAAFFQHKGNAATALKAFAGAALERFVSAAGCRLVFQHKQVDSIVFRRKSRQNAPKRRVDT